MNLVGFFSRGKRNALFLKTTGKWRKQFVPVVTNTKKQIEMDFTPGLTEQFPELMDLVAAVVYGCRIGLTGVAGYLDVSPSMLSRMLNKNPDEPRHLPLSMLPKIIEATNDRRIIFWQVEKFLEDKDTKRKRAMDEVAALVPLIEDALRRAK
jgi:hypothetical protein